MRHQDYWQKRFEQLEAAQNNKGQEYYYNLQEQYRKAIGNIEKDISKWYVRYASENGVTLAEAKRLLNSRELAEFRMGVKEYIEKGESLDPQWAKQLEAASVRVHVSRLEALKVQMQQQAENVAAREVDGLDRLARKVYTDGYYHTAFEVQKGIGVGWDFMRLDNNKIDKLISKPWAADGKNFSQRIWQNRAQLVAELENRLTQNIIRGESPKKVIADIAGRFKVNRGKAGRLIMTESTFFASAAQKDAFSELAVEQYEIIATLDTHTSETCRHLDGKVLPMSEYKPGVTAPPFHQWCRTTTAPYFEDDISERAARDADGKYYTVPASMKYEDWFNSFVDGGSKEGLQPAFAGKKNLADRIAAAKEAFQNKQQLFKMKRAALQDKEQAVRDLQSHIGDMTDEQVALKADIHRYKVLQDKSLDSQLEEKLGKRAAVGKEIEEVDAVSERWYKRPERGTPELTEWRAWRRSQPEDFMQNIYDKQVELYDKRTALNKEIDVLKKDIDFKKAFDLKAAEKRVKKLDALLKSDAASLNAAQDEIKALRAEVAALPAEIEQSVKAAGKEVIKDVQKNTAYAERVAEYERLREKNNSLAAAHKKASSSERADIFAEWTETYKKLQKAADEKFFKNADEVKAVLAQVREMGSDGLDVLKHLNNTKSKHKDIMLQAYDMYPKEWVEKSIQRGKLSVKAVSRGYYSDYKQLIAISGEGGSAFETAVHELGHRFEQAVPEILRAEKAFYDRRTDGEMLQWMGKGYGRDEESRFDKFITPYIGKDYGGTAYELVSMGFQYAYVEPEKLLTDPDMAEWIYGLLALQ